MLAQAGGRGHAQPELAPVAQRGQSLPGAHGLTLDFLRVKKELFSRLGEHHFFTRLVQQAAAHVQLQRFHRVADGRLGKAQFPCGLGKAPLPRQAEVGAQLL